MQFRVIRLASINIQSRDTVPPFHVIRVQGYCFLEVLGRLLLLAKHKMCVSEIINSRGIRFVVLYSVLVTLQGFAEFFLYTVRVTEIIRAVWFFLIYIQRVLVVLYGLVDFPLEIVTIREIVLDLVVHIVGGNFFIIRNRLVVILEQIVGICKSYLGLHVLRIALQCTLIVLRGI